MGFGSLVSTMVGAGMAYGSGWVDDFWPLFAFAAVVVVVGTVAAVLKRL
jgi:hypothetical protein